MNDDEPITRKLLTEAVDAILGGMQGMFDKMNEKLDARFDKIEAGLAKTDTKVDKMETKVEAVTTKVKTVKGQVNKLQRNTPTRDEFEAIKSKIYQHPPII